MRTSQVFAPLLRRFRTSSSPTGAAPVWSTGSPCAPLPTIETLTFRAGGTDPSPCTAARPPDDETPDEARQRLCAEKQQHADEMGWLTSLQRDVEDQSARVLQRLGRAQQDLAAAPHAAQQGLIREQVAVLERWQRALGKRQQDVTQRLAIAQDRLRALEAMDGCTCPAKAARPLA